MKTIEYTTIDRKALSWPSGEWDGEPDKCSGPMLRHGFLASLCAIRPVQPRRNRRIWNLPYSR